MKIRHGSYTGNGTSQAITTGITPAIVILKGRTKTQTIFAFASMPAGESVASETTPVLTDGVTALDATSFDVGVNVLANGSGVTYDWVAIEALAGEVFTGSYTGDGNDNRNITGVGFQPDIVIVCPQSANTSDIVWRTDDYAGDLASRLSGGGTGANFIQLLQADGFQIGNESFINGNTFDFTFCCIKNVSVRSATVTYSGNASDGRVITGVGFQPSVVIVQGSGGEDAAIRFLDQSGDASAGMDEAETTGRIQAFELDGFKVGTNPHVNASGQTYWAWALAGSQPGQFSRVNIIG